MEKNKGHLDGEGSLAGIDFFFLWAGAAVSLAEIWAGGTLVGVGFLGAAIAIVVGHVVGNTPLALGGMIGSRHGIPTMVSVRPSFGVVGARFAAILNVVQLVGWTAVMLMVCGNALTALFPSVDYRVWAAATGILTTLWALGGSRAWKWLGRTAVALLIILCVVMTWRVIFAYDVGVIVRTGPSAENPMGFGLALDLVIAMPISWLPLVSDYSRFARTTRGAFWGTWIGYFLVGSWMYLLGLVSSLATGTGTPDAMVIGAMGAMGLVVPAVLVVVFSTVTTTFLDIYSAAVSAESITRRLKGRWGVVLTGVVGTLVALVFPVEEYEGFLLFVGSVFCPLFGVVLADYFVIRRMKIEVEELSGPGRYWYRDGFNLVAFGAWLVGFGLYHLMTRLAPGVGASLPSMILAGVLYWGMMRAARKGSP
jgi:NCS1 family nucleobase:cation symporter-1